MKKLSKGLLFLLKLFVVVIVNSITVIVGAVPFFLLLLFIQLALSVFIDSFLITSSYTTKILLLLSLTGSLIYLMLHYIFMDVFERLEKKKLRKKWKEKIKDPLDGEGKK